MSVLQRFEKRLEGLVEGAFAKVFKGVVHPVEILNAMQREAEAHKAILAGGRTLVPNRYVIDLSPYDHSRLAPYAAALAQELAQSQAEFIQMRSRPQISTMSTARGGEDFESGYRVIPAQKPWSSTR